MFSILHLIGRERECPKKKSTKTNIKRKENVRILATLLPDICIYASTNTLHMYLWHFMVPLASLTSRNLLMALFYILFGLAVLSRAKSRRMKYDRTCNTAFIHKLKNILCEPTRLHVRPCTNTCLHSHTDSSEHTICTTYNTNIKFLFINGFFIFTMKKKNLCIHSISYACFMLWISYSILMGK